ncbi:MAG: hypothetical protein AB1730_22800 [Myxococcota bacterium]|jgi:methylphosphotriester-DNA--protein-cysteine methyltransferase
MRATRRRAQAFRGLREGKAVIEAQQAAEWESGSGFRDAFRRVLGGAARLVAKGTAKGTQTPAAPRSR